jgi:hypothetical protein
VSESEYISREIEKYLDEPEYLNDLRILRRFVQNGSFGFKQSDDFVFEQLKKRYPEAYNTFGEERRRETLRSNEDSPYIDEQKRTYPNNPDKDRYIEALKRLRYVMIMFRLGYGSREMAMLKVNSSRRCPEGYEAFEKELEDL